MSDIIEFVTPVAQRLLPYVRQQYAIATILALTVSIFAPLFVLSYVFFGLIGQKGFRRCVFRFLVSILVVTRASPERLTQEPVQGRNGELHPFHATRARDGFRVRCSGVPLCPACPHCPLAVALRCQFLPSTLIAQSPQGP